MIIDVVMPKMGESITEGTILEWRKNTGEAIEKDEILLESGQTRLTPKSHLPIEVSSSNSWLNQTISLK